MDIDFGSDLGNALATRMLLTDANLQAVHPNWPTGGTAAQAGIESNFNNDAVSPKGAVGLMQFEPATFNAVKAQMGRPGMDIHNAQDQLDAHQYLMMQNLNRTKGDVDGGNRLYNSGKADANNPETNNYVSKFRQRTGMDNPQPQSPQGQIDFGDNQPKQPEIDFGDGSTSADFSMDDFKGKPSQDPEWLQAYKNSGIGSNIGGLGLQGANLVAGGLEAIPIAGHALYNAATTGSLSSGVDTAMQDFSKYSAANLLNKAGIDQSASENSAAYQGVNKGMDIAFNQIPHMIGQSLAQESLQKAQGGMGYAGPGDQPLQEEMGNQLTSGLQLAALAEPGFHVPGIVRGLTGRLKGAPAESAAKLEPEDAPSAPMGPFQEGGGPLQGQPNAGPQRGPIAVDTQGVAYPAEGSISPEDIGVRAARENPNSGPQIEPDVLQQRMEEMRNATPEQLDIFKDTPEVAEDAKAIEETPRTLSSNEFAQTVQELASKDGTRFQVPEDMESAYSKYMDTVRDDQGQMFDRPTIAKNFTDLALQDSIERRIGDHPTVKANAARVADAQARVDALGDRAPQAARDALTQAQSTLQKSVTNIGNYFKETAKQLAPWEKDGIVYMNTFGDLSTLVKSLGAVLKGIHGVVFKTLDRATRSFGNLDSGSKIFGQGIKDAISRQANRDWSQTVNQKPIEQLSKVAGIRKAVTEMNPFAQESLSPEELKTQFNTAPDLSEGKVGNFLRNNFLPGGLMISDFSQHPLVKYVTDQVANGQRSAAKWVRTNLLDPKTGLRSMYKKLSTQAQTEMWTLKEAYEGTKEFTAAELKHRGYSDEAAAAYARTNELQKEAFSNYNEARVRAGEKPMEPRIAHIASYFTGDFRIRVQDAEGRMIASIGHNTKFGVQTVAQRFKELHPDGENLKFSKPELNRMQGGSDASFHGFMNILQELSKTNADVDRLVQSYRDTQMANTMKLSQMMNRGKFKSDASRTVGGAEGSKLWQSMEKNAQDGIKQQFKYLESMAKWTELQKAVDNGTKFIDDPEVNAPNAKAVSQRYLDNQMHRNLGALNDFTNSFMSGVAEVTGVGPTAMRSLAAGTKTGLLNMFVGLINFKHSIVTLSQPIWGIAPVNAVMQSRGAAFGKAQVLSVFKSLMSNKDILQGMVTKQDIKDPFVRAANQFAKDNDTFNTSQFQMGSVSKPATKLGTAMHINVTVPESGARAFTYMYYAHMLKDTVGDAMSDREIFGTAHNATQKVMGDYGQEAQAAIYNKMGFLGGLTKMLTTFKMNQVGQFATASKMFSQGQIRPMVVTLASSLASSGLRGFIGYNIANAALGQLTTWAAKNDIMDSPTNLDQIILHSLHGMNKGLADALNFGAMSGLGIDMTGSLSHADDIPMDPIGTLLPEGNPITKMIGSAFKVAQQPNEANAKAAAYNIAPNSAKGSLEKAWYTDNEGRYYDPNTGNQVSQRTPLDQGKRMLGFRPLEESKLRLETEVANGHEQQLAAVRNNITNRVLREADSNNGAVPNMTEYSQRYEKAGGDTNTLVAELVKHNGPDKALNIQQRQQGMATGNYTNAEKYVRSQGFKQP